MLRAILKNIMFCCVFCCFIFKGVAISNSIKKEEYPLYSAYISTRYITNGFGGVQRYEKYINYAFETSDGKVIFNEKELLDNYDGTNYSIEFKIGKTNKIIQYNDGKVRLVFVMTPELYRNIFNK